MPVMMALTLLGLSMKSLYGALFACEKFFMVLANVALWFCAIG
jgi:hypothetical protein